MTSCWPNSIKYDQEDYNLIVATPSAVDSTIDEIISQYVALDKRTRIDFLKKIDSDGQYALLHYARRTAVRAYRSKDRDILSRGLYSLAMLTPTDIDYRDLDYSIGGLLGYVARHLEADIRDLVRPIWRIASRRTKWFLRKARRPPTNPAELRKTGYYAVNTAHGWGILYSGIHSFSDSDFDLLDLGVEIALSFPLGKYHYVGIDSGPIPATWFRPQESSDFELILRNAPATIAVRAEILPRFQQYLWIWLAEVISDDEAEYLSSICTKSLTGKRAGATVGFNHGKLFVFIVGTSARADIPAVENIESLQQIAKLAKAIIMRHRAVPSS